MKKKEERRGNIINLIYRCCYFIVSIVIAIFLGLVTFKEGWPKEFLEEEKYYYQNLAENLWNNGLKSISKEINDIRNNCLYIEPFDETDREVYIELNEISEETISRADIDAIKRCLKVIDKYISGKDQNENSN